jgi:hypothetical protein
MIDMSRRALIHLKSKLRLHLVNGYDKCGKNYKADVRLIVFLQKTSRFTAGVPGDPRVAEQRVESLTQHARADAHRCPQGEDRPRGFFIWAGWKSSVLGDRFLL